MSKTIMISNSVYEELKGIKHDRSFTDTIRYLLEKKETKKTGAGLRKCAGLLDKDDDKYGKIMKELRPLYRKWTMRYN